MESRINVHTFKKSAMTTVSILHITMKPVLVTTITTWLKPLNSYDTYQDEQ